VHLVCSASSSSSSNNIIIIIIITQGLRIEHNNEMKKST
jgi:hypothetical protein